MPSILSRGTIKQWTNHRLPRGFRVYRVRTPPIREFESFLGEGYLSALHTDKSEWWIVKRRTTDTSVVVAIASLTWSNHRDVEFSACAVLPAYRRLGIHRALVATRLGYVYRYALDQPHKVRVHALAPVGSPSCALWSTLAPQCTKFKKGYVKFLLVL